MPYRKTFKKPARRPYVKKRAPRNAGTVALRMVKSLKRQVKPEIKYHEFKQVATPVNFGGVINRVHQGIPQGTNRNQRIGSRITPLRLSGKVMITYTDELAAAASTSVRLILFRAKQENTNFFQPEEVLQISGGSANNVIAPYDWDNRTHYQFIYDKVYTFSQGSSVSRILNWSFRLNGPVVYELNSDYQTETGGIFLLMISDQASNATTNPKVAYDMRLLYTDV